MSKLTGVCITFTIEPTGCNKRPPQWTAWCAELAQHAYGASLTEAHDNMIRIIRAANTGRIPLQVETPAQLARAFPV